jgi:hypothetical protein
MPRRRADVDCELPDPMQTVGRWTSGRFPARLKRLRDYIDDVLRQTAKGGARRGCELGLRAQNGAQDRPWLCSGIGCNAHPGRRTTCLQCPGCDRDWIGSRFNSAEPTLQRTLACQSAVSSGARCRARHCWADDRSELFRPLTRGSLRRVFLAGPLCVAATPAGILMLRPRNRLSEPRLLPDPRVCPLIVRARGLDCSIP